MTFPCCVDWLIVGAAPLHSDSWGILPVQIPQGMCGSQASRAGDQELHMYRICHGPSFSESPGSGLFGKVSVSDFPKFSLFFKKKLLFFEALVPCSYLRFYIFFVLIYCFDQLPTYTILNLNDRTDSGRFFFVGCEIIFRFEIYIRAFVHSPRSWSSLEKPSRMLIWTLLGTERV